MIKRMHHTGFVVSELEKAVNFYRDGAGLEVQARYERIGEAIDQVVGYEGAHLRIAVLGLGGEHLLELIEYASPAPAARPTQERSVLGASHLSFLVDDIEGTLDALSGKGARIMNRPAEVAPGRTACYLQDPDGNWIELMEIKE
jgi:catechol 2,3-dioxygenase-like lactoylglutathione lyase family enzyme